MRLPFPQHSGLLEISLLCLLYHPLPTHLAWALVPQPAESCESPPVFKKTLFYLSTSLSPSRHSWSNCYHFSVSFAGSPFSNNPLVASSFHPWPSYQSLHFAQIILCSSMLHFRDSTPYPYYLDLHIPQTRPTWTLQIQHVQNGLIFSPAYLFYVLYLSTWVRATTIHLGHPNQKQKLSELPHCSILAGELMLQHLRESRWPPPSSFLSMWLLYPTIASYFVSCHFRWTMLGSYPCVTQIQVFKICHFLHHL